MISPHSRYDLFLGVITYFLQPESTGVDKVGSRAFDDGKANEVDESGVPRCVANYWLDKMNGHMLSQSQ